MRQTGNCIRLLREALDSVVSPAVRDVMLESALAEVEDIPGDPDAFRSFVDGPLREALVSGLGVEFADSIADELRGIADQLPRRTPRRPARSITPIPRGPARNTPPRRARSSQSIPEVPESSAHPRSSAADPPGLGGVWRSDEYPSGVAAALGMVSLPAPALSAARPVVFLATSDAARAARLAALLQDRVEIAELSSLRELLLSLEAADEARVAILVDCESSPIRPVALAALAEELGPRVKVLLWGATPEIQRSVLRVSPFAARFLACAGSAAEEDIAVRCVAMVG